MKWSTHRYIADKISIELGLNAEETKILKEASVLPDKWGDFPHHKGTNVKIVNQITEARRNYLNKNRRKAMYHLGIALHYIADAYSLPHDNPMHDRYEETISLLNIQSPSYLPTLDKPRTLRIATNRPTSYLTPQIALNEAFKVCLWVAKSVLSNPIPPFEYIEEYHKSNIKFLKDKNRLKFNFICLCFGSVLLPFVVLFLYGGFFEISSLLVLITGIFSLVNFASIYPIFKDTKNILEFGIIYNEVLQNLNSFVDFFFELF